MEVDLFDNSDAATPRPAWHVIEAARRRYLTGVLMLDTTPPTNIYLRDGQVYFAERSTDGGLGVRLLVEGVITREQMHKGTLQVSGVEHLGRMFERDASIDRDAVELCVELMTDDVLTNVATVEVPSYKMVLYKRHPSGLDRWLPTRVEVVTHLVEARHLVDDEVEITPGEGPRTRTHLTPPPAAVAQPAPTVPVATAPVPLPPPITLEQPVVEQHVAEQQVVEQQVVEQPVVEQHVVEQHVVEQHVVEHEARIDTDSFDADITAELADDDRFHVDEPAGLPDEPEHAAADEGSGIVLAQSAVDAIMSTAIADEVADAVRRALAAIDTA